MWVKAELRQPRSHSTTELIPCTLAESLLSDSSDSSPAPRAVNTGCSTVLGESLRLSRPLTCGSALAHSRKIVLDTSLESSPATPQDDDASPAQHALRHLGSLNEHGRLQTIPSSHLRQCKIPLQHARVNLSYMCAEQDCAQESRPRVSRRLGGEWRTAGLRFEHGRGGEFISPALWT